MEEILLLAVSLLLKHWNVLCDLILLIDFDVLCKYFTAKTIFATFVDVSTPGLNSRVGKSK